MAIGDFSNLVTNPQMKKVLSDVAHIDSNKLGKNYQITNQSHGACTSGPATWYRRAGVHLTFWNGAQPYTSTHKNYRRGVRSATVADMKEPLIKAGFQIVWTGTGQQANSELQSSGILRPGDVATMLSSNSAHAAMWTGQDWRSDFLQGDKPYPYSSVGRGGNETFILWRLPGIQDEGQQPVQQPVQQNNPTNTPQQSTSRRPKTVYLWKEKKRYPAWGEMYTDANTLMSNYKVNTTIVDQIIRACIANGLSLNKTAVILANAFQESHFNPNAHNDIAGGHDGVWQFSSDQYNRFGLSNWSTQLQYLMEEVAPTKNENDYNRTVYSKRYGRRIPVTMWGAHSGGNGWTIKYKKIWDHSDDLDQLSKAFGEGWERYGYARYDTESRTQLARLFRDYLLNSSYAFGQNRDNRQYANNNQQGFQRAEEEQPEFIQTSSSQAYDPYLADILGANEMEEEITPEQYNYLEDDPFNQPTPTLKTYNELVGGSTLGSSKGSFTVQNNNKNSVDYYSLVSNFVRNNSPRFQEGGSIYERAFQHKKGWSKPHALDYEEIINSVWNKGQDNIAVMLNDGRYPGATGESDWLASVPRSVYDPEFDTPRTEYDRDNGIVLASLQATDAQGNPLHTLEDNGQYSNHSVLQGEDLVSIAERYNTSAYNLRQLNGLTSDQIAPGTIIRVPRVEYNYPRPQTVSYNGQQDDEKPEEPENPNVPKQPPEAVSAREPRTPEYPNTYYLTYVVGEGDSLQDILQRYGMSEDDFMTLNNLQTNTLQLGQRVKVLDRKDLGDLYDFSRPMYNITDLDKIIGSNLTSIPVDDDYQFNFDNINPYDGYLLRDLGTLINDRYDAFGIDKEYLPKLITAYVNNNSFTKATPFSFYYNNRNNYPTLNNLSEMLKNKGYDSMQILLLMEYLIRNGGENIPDINNIMSFKLSEELHKLLNDYTQYTSRSAEPVRAEKSTNAIERDDEEQQYNDPSAIRAYGNNNGQFYIPQYLTKTIDFLDEKQTKAINQNDVFESWAYYKPIIDQEFSGKNLPDIFKYIPLINYANPTYRDEQGRAGIWGMEIKPAKGNDLEVNSLVDERQDPFKSTQAAVRYLQDLYNIFNDVDTTLAAFLTDSPTIFRAVRRTGADPYTTVRYDNIKHMLPKNIQQKVEQLHNIYNSSNQWGSQLNLNYTYPYNSTVSIDQRVNLNQIASVLGIPYTTLQALNPQFRSNGDVPGGYRPQEIVLPPQYVSQFNSRLQEILNYGDNQYQRLIEVEPGSKVNDNKRVYSQPVQQVVQQNPAMPKDKYKIDNQEDLVKINDLLQDGTTEYNGGNTDPNSLMLFYANEFMNKPYAAHTLDGNEERIVINPNSFDDNTFVETLCALVRTTLKGGENWEDYATNLENVMYRNGQMSDYASRLHYVSDWINDNIQRGNLIDVVAQNPTNRSVGTINKPLFYMSTNRGEYSQLSDEDQYNKILQVEQNLQNNKFYYIKKEYLNSAYINGVIKPGDIIAYVTNTNGLDVTHLGIADYNDDHQLILIDASPNAGRVVRERKMLFTVLGDRDDIIGVRVFRVKQ